MILEDMHSSMPPSNVINKKRVFCYQLERLLSMFLQNALEILLYAGAEKSIILQENNYSKFL